MHNVYSKELNIDLSNRKIDVKTIEEQTLIDFIGGSGYGIKRLYDETDQDTKALGSENLLIFAAGALTGSKFFNSNRFHVVTKSPLTGILGESNCGGKWGERFKSCGYDALVLRGASDEPVYIYIDNQKTEIKKADDLWGKDTFETNDILKKMYGTDCEVACIGPAGENLVNIASIMTDGEHGRAAGRCGVGAVMGSKNVKAVVVKGGAAAELAEQESLKNLMKSLNNKFSSGVVPQVRDFGTSGGVVFCEEIGNLPIKNWGQSRWQDGAKKINGIVMAEKYLKKRYNCGRCVIRCGRTVVSQYTSGDKLVGGPEYETVGLLGSNCLIDDLAGILKLNELCNRLGLDTISAGGVIGFIMEVYENNLISDSDMDYIIPAWGDVEAAEKLIVKISRNEGIGKLLGQGVKQASVRIGPEAEKYAIHVKGLEPPAHDPRAKTSTALSFATSNRGACHLQAFTSDFDEALPIHGLGVSAPSDRFSTDGKGEFVARMQNLMCLFDSFSCCKFLLFAEISVDVMAEVLRYSTGMDISASGMLKTGERIFNLKRMYNVREGISRKDDILPERFYINLRTNNQNEKEQLERMLNDYYSFRDWDSVTGIPKDGKLKELGIGKYIKEAV